MLPNVRVQIQFETLKRKIKIIQKFKGENYNLFYLF